MAKKIFKYGLGVDGFGVDLDDYVLELLHIDTQDGWPTLWALIDTDKELNEESIRVYCYGTGWPIPDGLSYIGTAFDERGFVWHYFVDSKYFEEES